MACGSYFVVLAINFYQFSRGTGWLLWRKRITSCCSVLLAAYSAAIVCEFSFYSLLQRLLHVLKSRRELETRLTTMEIKLLNAVVSQPPVACGST